MAVFMTMPDAETECAGCGHWFGEHWVTHNGERQGCVVLEPVEEKQTEPCVCRAFSVAWSPDAVMVIQQAPLDTAPYMTAAAAQGGYLPDGIGSHAPEPLPPGTVGGQWERTP